MSDPNIMVFLLIYFPATAIINLCWFIFIMQAMLSQILNIIVVFFSVRVLTKEDTQAMKQKLYDFSDYISLELRPVVSKSKEM